MKIDRALIIRRQGVKLSQDYAAVTAESCEKHNLPYEFIDAIEFLECDDAFKKVGAFKSNIYNNSIGNCCCHASHILSWKRIVEIDKPCIILEHDAVILGDVRNIDIPDMAVVTFGHRVADINDYTPPNSIEKLVKVPRAIGVHACGLSPKTAKWLYEDAQKNGITIGVDRWLMMQRRSGLPLYVAEPPQAVCWARMSTMKMQTTSKAKHIDPKQSMKSQVQNYKEALTPGWFKGLKK